MQFMITAYDGKDSAAGARRNAAREQHLEGVKKAKKEDDVLWRENHLTKN